MLHMLRTNLLQRLTLCCCVLHKYNQTCPKYGLTFKLQGLSGFTNQLSMPLIDMPAMLEKFSFPNKHLRFVTETFLKA